MKIALIGDVAPIGRFCLQSNPFLLETLRPICEYLHSFDLVVANLETPLTNKKSSIIGKSATIRSHPRNIDLLNALGVTHVNLANNHIGDFGYSAYEDTILALETARIDWFGTNGRQLNTEYSSEKLSFLGFCSYNTNPAPLKDNSADQLNYLDVEKVEQSLKLNSSKGYFSILSIHSGQEHVHMPSSDDVFFARRMAEFGPYVYYGHHPHVVQGFEEVKRSLIFYSLGNFIFDDVFTNLDKKNPLVKLSNANKTGAIGELEVCNGEIKRSGITPTILDPPNFYIGGEKMGERLKSHNDCLIAACTSQYNRKREKEITSYLNRRRSLRNLRWYFRRISLNSLVILLRAYRNKVLFRKCFIEKLKNMEHE